MLTYLVAIGLIGALIYLLARGRKRKSSPDAYSGGDGGSFSDSDGCGPSGDSGGCGGGGDGGGD